MISSTTRTNKRGCDWRLFFVFVWISIGWINNNNNNNNNTWDVVAAFMVVPSSSSSSSQRQIISQTKKKTTTRQWLVSSSSSSSVVSVMEHIEEGIGISSLVFHEKEAILYAGTKRGNVLSYSLPSFLKTHYYDTFSLSSLPIYSMTILHDHHHDHPTPVLACGGGDRYVTLLPINTNNTNTTTTTTTVLQRLGPHTGWVKQVLTPSSKVLYSIGCNCIETWNYHSSNSDNCWKHQSTTRLESCPTLGCTLSSDLLCLCFHQNYLFIGGVDGRIHIYDTTTSSMTHIQTIAAHNGRVHQLLILSSSSSSSNDSTYLCSIGQDGTLQCRSIINTTTTTTGGKVLLGLHSQISLKEDDDRILCMTRLNNENRIAMGTALGKIYIVQPLLETIDITTTIQINNHTTTTTTIIHSLCFLPNTHQLAIGHSKGLSIYNLPSSSS